jgi:PPOX class probable F420-dependent enzyme
MSEPISTAPRMPAGYGVPTDGSGGDRLPWSRAVERLTAARSYWIATTSPAGRPHAMPVWGLWLDDAVWFATGRDTAKARNLTADGRVVVHLESGDDVVIIEGEVREQRDPAALEAFADAYLPKYGVRPDPADPENVVYAVAPRVAHTWEERDFPGTATRWVFP